MRIRQLVKQSVDAAMNAFVVLCAIIALFVAGSDAFSASAAKKSGFSRPVFLKKVSGATKDNFAKDIMNSETEKFILESAGSRIYEKYRKSIRKKGKELGIDVPSAWARHPIPVKEPEPSEEGDEEAPAEEAAAEEAAPAEE